MNSEPPLIAVPNQPKTKVTPPGAVWSLVLGILSLFCLWLLGSIPAIILGSLSIRKAKANPEAVGGEGLALAGIITGAIGVFTGFITVGVVASVMIPSFAAVKIAAEDTEAVNQVREIAMATLICAADHPEEEFPESLEDLIPEFLPDDSKFVISFADGTSSVIQYRKITASDHADVPMLLLKLPGANRYVLGYRDGSVQKLKTPLEQSVLESFEE